MPIAIRENHAKDDIWCFYLSWLKRLKSSNPQSAFTMLDAPSRGGIVWNAEEFSKLLTEFSNMPEEQYNFSDITLNKEEVEDCYVDSSIYKNYGGTFHAWLYLPLVDKGSSILVLDFFFTPVETGFYKVILNGDDPLVV